MIQPLYLLGIGCDALAWIGALIALQRLPLFTVQAILAGSLAVTVVLARLFLDARLHLRDHLAVAIVGVGLVLGGISAGVQTIRETPAGFVPAMFLGLALVTGLTLWAYRHGGPLLLAGLSGLAFSGGALGARALGITELSLTLLADPILWAMAGYGFIAILALSRSLERGDVGPAMAVMWMVDVIVPGLVGVVVLGDTVRPGWTVPAILAVGLSVAGCVVLALGQTALQPAGKVHPARTAIL